ncbi:MAG: phosphate/phosphite/phosphonate ABC transporter substrate-binding protein [Betaproteobacteria bacterium]|nr:phosphate/phosphite/phosphonate ABC transporter substrate-binding protein [Betaproteobacteria bacterium]
MNATRALFAAAIATLATGATAQNCPHRGELDDMYCDANKDMVADVPTDPKKLKNPSTLVFTYTPIEDPAVYQNIFKDFTEKLGECTGKKVVYYQVQSNAAQIEAMRAGRLHIAGFSTGGTGYAVNLAGAVPFVVKGDATGPRSYHLALIVRADSPYQKASDLKGRKVAHVSPSSNSGNLAPRALFPALGLEPDKDYKPLYSGKHDQSILGVNTGDYDAAAVADDVLARMAKRGVVKAENFRKLYVSPPFVTSSFALAHDLEPALAAKIRECATAYKFTAEMTKEFNGDDRFWPVDYQKDWAVVRQVAEATGTPFNRAAFDREAAKEAEAKKKK